MKFRGKYRYVFPLLFVLGMVAILTIQVFYLKQFYNIEKKALKKDLENAFQETEYDLFRKTHAMEVNDSSSMYVHYSKGHLCRFYFAF